MFGLRRRHMVNFLLNMLLSIKMLTEFLWWFDWYYTLYTFQDFISFGIKNLTLIYIDSLDVKFKQVDNIIKL